jgi:vacuolar-type H+-ATPase subunit C/Vma6
MRFQVKVLLQDPENRGYPTDYLLARVAGKRAHLIRDWKPLAMGTLPPGHVASPLSGGLPLEDSPDAAWRWLEKEYRWVYFQMNEMLRTLFLPFFAYSELRILIACLRYIHNGQRGGAIDNALSTSMLSEKVGAILKMSGDVPSAAGSIENLLSPLSSEFKGLARIAEGEGLRGFESALTNRYLAYAVRSGLHPLLRAFFARLIDARNIMSVYKYLRLDENSLPPLNSGGRLPAGRYKDIAERKDLAGFISVIKKLTGIRIERPDATNVENSLYQMVTKFMRKEGRKPLEIGLILDYLWRCSLQAMNLSVLFHCKDLAREEIMTELAT